MDNLIKIDTLTAKRVYRKLLNKGFVRVVYTKQEKPNTWYRIEFTNEQDIKKFIDILKEDKWQVSQLLLEYL